MKSICRFFCIALCVILLVVFVKFSFNTLSVQAHDSSRLISEKTLYNETNTYDISNECFEGNDFFVAQVEFSCHQKKD